LLKKLILLLGQANPPQLHSNLQYIQRFRRRTRLISESAYFFTNILSAESFVWNIDGEALSMDETAFQRKMDAAQEQKLSLSLPSGPSDTNKVNSENSPAQLNDPSIGDDTRDLENEGRTVVVMEIKQPTAPELQKKGSSELLKEDDVSRYVTKMIISSLLHHLSLGIISLCWFLMILMTSILCGSKLKVLVILMV
jgi:Rab5 GDP/GTP exchange factor